MIKEHEIGSEKQKRPPEETRLVKGDETEEWRSESESERETLRHVARLQS